MRRDDDTESIQLCTLGIGSIYQITMTTLLWGANTIFALTLIVECFIKYGNARRTADGRSRARPRPTTSPNAKLNIKQ